MLTFIIIPDGYAVIRSSQINISIRIYYI